MITVAYTLLGLRFVGHTIRLFYIDETPTERIMSVIFGVLHVVALMGIAAL